jgi:hypothetical protein
MKKITIKKDGTQYYRVFEGRKRIGSFLNLSSAEEYKLTVENIRLSQLVKK